MQDSLAGDRASFQLSKTTHDVLQVGPGERLAGPLLPLRVPSPFHMGYLGWCPGVPPVLGQGTEEHGILRHLSRKEPRGAVWSHVPPLQQCPPSALPPEGPALKRLR